MGTRLIALVLLLVVSGCTPRPETTPAQANNATDVMFLQMGLAQIDEGDDLATLVAQRAEDPALRTLATDLGGQWREEDGTMRRWLLGWQQPLTPGPGTDHAGHGHLHTLRPADLADLKSRKSDFDRTAVGLLLSHLGNCVETSRMESAGGAYPPARALARTITERRQSQVRALLTMAASG
ncbi:DUF305 domain-containing protein [Actinoplanes sp. TBRC 11911]|uniref:DUF305 domain-containing protein n=1 Tax=Actinoplanes sp. TBRC 11911 TaxID=2729386 RepID=UPI00145E72A5|nr:DUF305 domain-containing protein [Actinoplanes sp. TBRC 11911]NMO53566.1 DUF305 domain-containing protein [Actinoplanes sp. TBRC 11911]